MYTKWSTLQQFKKTITTCNLYLFFMSDYYIFSFLLSGETAQCGPGPPHFWGLFVDHTQSYATVGRLLWTSDRPSQRRVIYHTTDLNKYRNEEYFPHNRCDLVLHSFTVCFPAVTTRPTSLLACNTHAFFYSTYIFAHAYTSWSVAFNFHPSRFTWNIIICCKAKLLSDGDKSSMCCSSI